VPVHIARTPARGDWLCAASKNDWRPYISIESPLGQFNGVLNNERERSIERPCSTPA